MHREFGDPGAPPSPPVENERKNPSLPNIERRRTSDDEEENR